MVPGRQRTRLTHLGSGPVRAVVANRDFHLDRVPQQPHRTPRLGAVAEKHHRPPPLEAPRRALLALHRAGLVDAGLDADVRRVVRRVGVVLPNLERRRDQRQQTLRPLR